MNASLREETLHFLKMILVRGEKEPAAVAYHFLIRLSTTKQEFLELLSLVLHDRQNFRLKSLKRSDRVAHRLVLGEDLVGNATKPALEKHGAKRSLFVNWDLNRTYGNILRLIRLTNRISLEDAPNDFVPANQELLNIRVTKKELEETGNSLEFHELLDTLSLDGEIST